MLSVTLKYHQLFWILCAVNLSCNVNIVSKFQNLSNKAVWQGHRIFALKNLSPIENVIFLQFHQSQYPKLFFHDGSRLLGWLVVQFLNVLVSS